MLRVVSIHLGFPGERSRSIRCPPIDFQTMTYTEHSDVYSAVHEDGVNTVIKHLRQKRPSLFNYGTDRVVRSANLRKEFRASFVARRSRGLCAELEYADEVLEWENPLLTEVDPLPVLGTNGVVALDYCFQVADLSIDFSPDDPPADIGEQQFAASVVVCAGLACPTEQEFDRVRNEVIDLRREHGNALTDPDLREELGLPIVPQAESLECFCLGITVIGSVSATGPGVSGPWLEIPNTPELRVDDIIFETEEQELHMPSGLTGSITCYIRSFVEFSLLPWLSEALANLTPKLPADSLLALDLSGTRATASLPTSTDIPNNPALEDDQLKVYADLALTGPGGP